MHNFLRSKEYGDFLNYYNDSLKIEIKERTTKLEEAYRETLVTLVRASEFRDEDTGFHINRIGRYSCALAELLGMDEDFIKTILLAALMHDVGKIGIPDSILLKHGKLTAEEMQVMQSHCMLGAEILRGGNSRYLTMGSEIALSHHEHWDGSGYPEGLAGSRIPLSARITQIADVYDALRSRRPYKPPLDHEITMRILTEGDGRTMPSHFDPDILTVFRENADVFDSIYNSSNAVSEKQGSGT
jgi:putative two-component system response regulator